jgi:hypothetical protein
MVDATTSGSYVAVAASTNTASTSGSYTAVSSTVRTATVSSSYTAVAATTADIFDLYHWLGSGTPVKSNLFRWDGANLQALGGPDPVIPPGEQPAPDVIADPIQDSF